MMEVYEFNKVFQTRFSEIMDVLYCKTNAVPASDIRSQFAYDVELQIEPIGWQALWKISRVTCEELKIKYPTVVFGVVQNIHFKELKAIFKVIAVEEDDVHIPEIHEVPLEELWATKVQENDALNSERTAECIDKLRFFYTNIWMPWDSENDDDQDWEEKYLHPRLQFYYDLKSKKMDRKLSAHILSLLTEARYIQERRQFLEMDLSDDEENNSDNNCVKDLMRLHLRMNMIKNEIEILQNPEMRNVYKEIMFNKEQKLDSKNEIFVVWKRGNLDEQISYLELARSVIGKEKNTNMCSSLQEALNNCNSSDIIYIPQGCHSIKFLECLNNKGALKSLVKNDPKLTSKIDYEIDAVIRSNDDDSILLSFDGDFVVENVVLDCRNIRTGVLIRHGNVILRNCVLLGDSKSSTKQGIVSLNKSELILENCFIKDFAIGISLQNHSKISLVNSIITDCNSGIEITDNCLLELNGSTISNSKINGIYFETKTEILHDNKTIIMDKITDLTRFKEFSIKENNVINENLLGNIAISKKKFFDNDDDVTGFNNFHDHDIGHIHETKRLSDWSIGFRGFDNSGDVMVIDDSLNGN